MKGYEQIMEGHEIMHMKGKWKEMKCIEIK